MKDYIRVGVFLLLLFQFYITSNAEIYELGSVREFSFVNENNEINNVSPEILADNEFPDQAGEDPLDAIFSQVINENRFVTSIDKALTHSLPIGIKAKGETDPSFALIIDKATIYPEYAEFSAFMVLSNPFDNTKIRFRADKVKFSFKGGLIDGITLRLIEGRTSKLVNDVYLNWLPGSYVSWNCNGLKNIGLNGELELSEKRFQAVNTSTGEVVGKVKYSFFATIDSFKDFVLNLSLPAFKITGIDEVFFSFSNLVLDFSDKSNAPGFKLPGDYPGGFVGPFENLWRGIYVSEAQVFLSPKLKSKKGYIPTVSAKNVFIDDYGFTGDIKSNVGKEVLPFDEGLLGSWPFSIDDVEIKIVTGNLEAFKFSGEIQVPGSNSRQGYYAYVDAENNYYFGVQTGRSFELPVFIATINIDKTSYIEVAYEQGAFYPTAFFNGTISFLSGDFSSNSNAIINIPSLKFQGLRISTIAPILDLDYIAFDSKAGQPSLGGFALNVLDLDFLKKIDYPSFKFDLGINLLPKLGGGLSTDASVNVIGDITGLDWKFKGLNISKIKIEYNKPGAFDIAGELSFFNGDEVYGRGFRGGVKANFVKTFSVDAVGVFGNVNDSRYCMVDAFFKPGGTGIPAGPFILTGFGGGLSYGMMKATEENISSDFGKSLSGVTYIPDNTMGLGITAGLTASIVNKTLINGDITLSVLFNKSGGINDISFLGQAVMLSPSSAISSEVLKNVVSNSISGKEQTAKTSELMRARLLMKMDFEASTFHSELDVFLNAGLIKGRGAGDRAGWAVLHIAPDKWFLHIGTPSDPIGVEIINLVELNSYFMAGHDIPDAMMMNKKVLSILNMTQEDFNGNRDDGTLMKGRGLAFGANVSMDTGDLRFLIFYAAFELGLGFDVMVLDYGDDVYCKGSSGPVGINGWFAKGQAYAYFSGEIGLTARIFGRRRKFEILSLKAAAAMRLEGPNPFWLKAVVGGRYRVLGGIIRGNCKFQVTLGDKCEMVNGVQDLSDLKVIGDITPSHESDQVDPFILPQVIFNMPVGKVLRFSEDENTTKEYRVNLVEYSLYKDNTLVPGTIEWDEDNTSFAFSSNDVFYPLSKYKLVVKISFDEKVKGNWVQFMGDDGKVYYETEVAEFTTGILPDEIPESAIAFSYPLKRMVNFYRQEYPTAYIGFNRGLPGYFEPQSGYKQMIRWMPVKSGEPVFSDFQYINTRKMVETRVPDNLLNGAVYHFELVANGDISRNIETNTQTLFGGDDDDDKTEMTTRSADGIITDSEEKVFYSLAFRTSNFNRFYEKIGVDELDVRFLYNVSPAIDYPGFTIFGSEMLDSYEIQGTATIEPLVRCSAVLESSDWYMNTIFPLMYQGYPLHENASITSRNVGDYGLPPYKPIKIWQVDFNYLLNDGDVKSGTFSSAANKTHFVNAVPGIWANDYIEIRNKLSNLIDAGKLESNPRVSKILSNYPWPQVDAGNYPLKIEYVLPGTGKVSSTHILNVKNPFDVPQVNLIQ